MRFIITRGVRTAALALILLLSAGGVARAQTIQNAANGSTNGIALNPVQATVSLNRVGAVAPSATAEIAPNAVQVAAAGQAFVYHVLPDIDVGEGVDGIEIQIPPGYGAPVVSALRIGGVPQGAACPTPGTGQYCASFGSGTLTLVLGQRLTMSAAIAIDFMADTPGTTGTADFTSIVADGASTLPTLPGDADGDPNDNNSVSVEVLVTQGLVLQLTKSANKREATVGEVVTYSVVIRNTDMQPVTPAFVEDDIPPNFKYIPGSVRLDGGPANEPSGARPLIFDLGSVPGLVDGNGNGTADPGEPGYRVLTYQLVIGAGALPGKYTNTAVTFDVCSTCLISNESTAVVEVALDPLFDLGTIIGKVFEDRNRNEWQDPGEAGVPNAMVALDDGTYALTDEHGRYHFPVVAPGQRMLKINMHSLTPGSEAATQTSEIVQVTPGLLVKVNFGVLLPETMESIGAPSVKAVSVTAEDEKQPVEIRGSALSPLLLINGTEAALPTSDVRLGVSPLAETFVLVGDRLDPPARFELEVDRPGEVAGWTISIRDGRDRVVRKLDGDGEPPPGVIWDGRRENGAAVDAGEIYSYQLDVRYRDGSLSTSPRRLLGINRTEIVSLNLRGEAFEFGRAELSAKTRRILTETAEALRRFPDEKVLIEGHTDSVGSREYNFDLSMRRANAAATFLVEEMHLEAERFAVHGYGEDRPIASNDFDEGRALNRRVQLKGKMERNDAVAVLDNYRVAPSVAINGTELDLAEQGRFGTSLDGQANGTVEVEMAGPGGRMARATIAVPDIVISLPAGRVLLPYGGQAGGCCATAAADGGPPEVSCEVIGRTQPGNRLEIDGNEVPIDTDGGFAASVGLAPGSNRFGLVATNARGVSRIAHLDVELSDRDAEGRMLLVSGGVPQLTVSLPPEGVRLTVPAWNLFGETAPDTRVEVNGREIEVDPDGRFSEQLELPLGPSRLVVQATGADGSVGTIEREIDVARHRLFLLAFADGEFGRRKAEGSLEGAGLTDADDYYSEGRLAFYLKGVISGKYLITAAFDTEKSDLSQMFDGFDGEATQTLLRNLDPDKLYPVYGDSSTVVWDAQSDGKLYLALESDEIQLLIGNFPLSLNDTELAQYRRTLYGGTFSYRSLARTKYGAPDTEVTLFVAEVRQQHVQDELRATGGSIYYLSQRDVVEGSEEVTLVVRDKNTGLMLRRDRQVQNVDYLVKYPEGRVMFQRPIPSVVASGTPVDQEVLADNPVFVQVDYETRLESLDKTGYGGRVRRQIGDHVSVGATYIEDEQGAGPYQLGAVDAEVRLGQNTRLVAEYADSEGSDGRVFFSDDGGLTYTEATTAAASTGSAWKVATELDVGEWFGTPDRYQVNLFYREQEPGFVASGTFADQGTERIGAHVSLDVTSADTIQLRHDRERRTPGGGAAPAAMGETTLSSAQWNRIKKRWGISVEYLSSEIEDDVAVTVTRSSLGAARFWAKLTDKLTARLEHQQTFSGVDNDQSTAGLEYQVLPSLALSADVMAGDRGESARLGAIVTRGDTRIYLMQQLDESTAGRTQSTVVGTRAPLGQSTQVYSEYQWERSERDERTVSLIGLQQQWDITDGLRFVLGGEVANVDSATLKNDRSAFSTLVAYGKADLKVFTRQEVRRDSGTLDRIQYFTVNQLDYQVNPATSVLARYRYSKTWDRDSDLTDSRFEERTVGVAFRPVTNDRFNALARYTALFDQRPLETGQLAPTENSWDVIAVETIFDISRRWQWTSKGALRWREERVGGLPESEVRSVLVIQRFDINLWKPIDLGVEYRILDLHETHDRREGWLGELTWELMQRMRIGAGYNFTDFSDDELSTNDYSVEGWFFRIQGRY